MNTVYVVLVSMMLAGVPGDMQWHGPLAPGRLVAIHGVTGNIRALPSLTGEVEVFADFGTGEDARKVDVKVLAHANGLTICAAKNDSDDCDGAPSAAGLAPRVDFTVRLPQGVNFHGRTVNGGIQATALAGNVEAFTVNGGVNVSTTGSVRAHAVNGSIQADLLRPWSSKAPELSTVNGGITVRVPNGVSAALKAETRNGKVVSKLASFAGTATEQSVEGELGRGGGDPLTIRAINGTIELQEQF